MMTAARDENTMESTSAGSSVIAVRREGRIATAFVEIIGTLVDDFEVVDVLTVLAERAAELVPAGAAGILLVDDDGRLRVMAVTNEQIEQLELIQIENDEGPCVECFHTGTIVARQRLDQRSPWPRFAAESVLAGYTSVCAIPLHLKARMLGCLNLFIAEPAALPPTDVAVAQAFADVASVAIVQDQVTRLAAIREAHLRHALISRVAIEQAKGMIAQHARVDMNQAFARLRSHARSNNLNLTQVAQDVIAARIPIGAVAGPRRPPRAPPPNLGVRHATTGHTDPHQPGASRLSA